MVIHTQRPVLDRVRSRMRGRPPQGARRDGEFGSLILDILIGMAIFALVAIIAVSAVGQYRMRAYVQTAVSDATAVANAVSASITDHATDNTGGADYPTGSLGPAALASLEVTPTGTGARASTVVVTPNAADPLAFNVCVEHRGAYAEYDSNEGIVGSGVMADEGFAGCDYVPPVDGGDDDDDTPATVPGPTNVRVSVEGNEATVTWNPVGDASGYAVHLDAATTPTWNGGGTTATLPGLSDGNHTVTVTATVDGQTTAPSAPETFTIEAGPTTTPVDWTGYPDNAGGYGDGTGPSAGMQCPTLVGVESRWAGVGEQYIFIVTYAETNAEFVARTGKPYAEQVFRLINANTGQVGGWETNTAYTINNNQKSGLRTSGVSAGNTFYVEVASRNWTGGGQSGKCQAVGKLDLRKTENWTAGTVQTLDGSAVAPGFTERRSTVPCPQVSEVTYRHTFSYDHIQFKMENLTGPQYTWFWQVPQTGYGKTYNSSWNVWPPPGGNGYKMWSINDYTWAGGDTRRINIMVQDTSRTANTNMWSDYCTISVEATKPMGVGGSDSIENVPGRVVTVDPYWGGFGYGAAG